MEEPFSPAELAQRAAQDVAVVAGNLQAKWRGSWFMNPSRQKRIKNLAILATSLMSISFIQDKYEQGKHRDKQNDEMVKLETFLCGLELRVKYPINYLAKSNEQNKPSARFPTLNTLVTASSTDTIRSTSDISMLRKVEKSVEEFASAKQRKTRAVGFGDEMCHDGVEDEARRYDATEGASTSEFCKLLGRDIGSGSMDVRIRNEKLFILQRAVEIEVDIANGRSISLADVLSNYSLVPKTKLVLAYILAKSVWQFYDSDFMGVCWTTRSIQLFREREDDDDDDDDEPGVDWAPYYAFSLEQMTERGSVERLPPGQFLHRYPRILALGAILYELGQKKRWEKQATYLGLASCTNHIEPPTLERIINDTSSTIRKGIQKKKWPDINLKNTQTLEEYRVIVANCASENFFRPELKEKSPLFKKVVAPLKEMVQTTGWVDESGNIQRFSMKGATTRLKDEGPDSGKPRSETLLDTSQTSQEFRTPPSGLQDSRRASGFVTS
ncbi:hypothetical protein ACHAO4_002895 [Trichoderma viride]